ncbi:MAG TPA: hypothetical protein VII58_09455 [Acidobacteriaceae bacterium]
MKITRRRSFDDLRRAYEHLARIDILEGALYGPAFCDVSTLAAQALTELNAGRYREAADLLCAAEHISFAVQAPHGYASGIRMSDELRNALRVEFDALVQRADLFRLDPNSPRHGVVPEVCARTLQMANEAYTGELFSRALELARAAELLAEVAVRSAIVETQSLAS